jgi:concanavalin A-like lectin/glucanase superfamily protein/List-Bact-rpt repeat protein/immunoglobulin I-set domain protein/thrombospondin type 3 repeat protein
MNGRSALLIYSYDANGNVVSGDVTGVSAPQIIGNPVNQIVEPGQIATFSVLVANASGIAFQWMLNGAAIVGQTGDTLLLTNVGPTNEGQYSVQATNSAGSATSAPAALFLDSDGDGLPDSWEIANFGNLASQRAAGDPDGDGVSNLDEFLDGTNPNSSASVRPRLHAYGDSGGSVMVVPLKPSYGLGEAVTLTAVPTAPNVFVGWAGDLKTGDLVPTTNPVTLMMTGNKTVRGKFASALPLTPGLVAFWRGEADAKDLIGGHHGTFFAGASAVPPNVTAFGKVGGAFAFDGTIHVRVPDAGDLKPAQVTVEAWVFPTLQSNSYQTVVARGFSGSDDDSWFLGIVNGQPHFWTFPSADLVAPIAIPLNQWTHLAATFDGTTKRLYVNGAQVASQSGLGSLVYDPALVPVTIGSDWAFNASSARFNGLIDEVAPGITFSPAGLISGTSDTLLHIASPTAGCDSRDRLLAGLCDALASEICSVDIQHLARRQSPAI